MLYIQSINYHTIIHYLQVYDGITSTSTSPKNSIHSYILNALKYEEFINEKSINPTTGKEQFTHRRLMAAYKSLRKHLPYLFTYKNYPNLQVPNTTNSLDGGIFTQLKKLIKLHQEMSISLKIKLIDDCLVNYNKNYDLDARIFYYVCFFSLFVSSSHYFELATFSSYFLFIYLIKR